MVSLTQLPLQVMNQPVIYFKLNMLQSSCDETVGTLIVTDGCSLSARAPYFTGKEHPPKHAKHQQPILINVTFRYSYPQLYCVSKTKVNIRTCEM